ncbi:MAG: NADAR family protein [Bacteroidia bacterium]|nr:NADAR family protein [Bacteroidia bacterium]
MKYNYNSTIEKYRNGEKLEFIFFWGHKLSDENHMDKACLSQWYESEFEYQGIRYSTVEHWMMAEKAKLFGDEESLKRIIDSKTPKEAKEIGRQVKGFSDSIWIPKRESIVMNGNYLKFKQNVELGKYLDGTGEKILVEASPYDKIWGIGMKWGEHGIEDPNTWKGLNLLGYTLMEVRDKLRNPLE